MKLVTYEKKRHSQLAFLYEGILFDTNKIDTRLPSRIDGLLNNWQQLLPIAQKSYQSLRNMKADGHISIREVKILAPVPHPPSFRDAYAFRQHVETARKNRGLRMIPEFEAFPVFYFSNPLSITGPGDIFCMPDHFNQLDFELEVAAVIGKRGINIRASQADEHIAGFMILNDFSARQMQMEEMKLNLGPAKGKDFATAIGPMLVTPDELQQVECDPKSGHIGKSWNLKMTCRVNGILLSEGNLKDMEFTFAEIIERCSYGVELQPGDVIGSGTVGSGCFLELNGTGKRSDPNYKEQWLQAGDVVELEIENLGILKNTIRAHNSGYSLKR